MWWFRKSDPEADKILASLDEQKRVLKAEMTRNQLVRDEVERLARKRKLIGEGLLDATVPPSS